MDGEEYGMTSIPIENNLVSKDDEHTITLSEPDQATGGVTNVNTNTNRVNPSDNNKNPFIEALNITANLTITPENAVSIQNEPELNHTLAEFNLLNDICNNAISTVDQR